MEHLRPYHYRTEDGAEVDAVLEAADGRIEGAEVKASSTARSEDPTALRHLGARTEQSTVGLVLYTGTGVLSFGDGRWDLPLAALRRA